MSYHTFKPFMKYRLIMTTVLEVTDIAIIQNDLRRMQFGKIPEILTIIDKGTELIEETKTNERDTKTFIRIDSVKNQIPK